MLSTFDLTNKAIESSEIPSKKWNFWAKNKVDQICLDDAKNRFFEFKTYLKRMNMVLFAVRKHFFDEIWLVENHDFLLIFGEKSEQDMTSHVEGVISQSRNDLRPQVIAWNRSEKPRKARKTHQKWSPVIFSPSFDSTKKWSRTLDVEWPKRRLQWQKKWKKKRWSYDARNSVFKNTYELFKTPSF